MPAIDRILPSSVRLRLSRLQLLPQRREPLYPYPLPELSTAENILRILRPDSSYTELEAKILDLALVLHAEHGGGNNSTFTTHVVSSSGTDTYSTVAASLGSLKGPKHGGANIKVVQMFEDMKRNIANWKNEDEVAVYLKKLLHKEAFDCAGLIYGMGHAVYSLSDPRANIFKGFVERLSEEKGRTDEYELYSTVAKLAPQIIAEERKIYKGVSANIDFLQRLCLQHARPANGTLYADFCHLPHCGLERAPY